MRDTPREVRCGVWESKIGVRYPEESESWGIGERKCSRYPEESEKRGMREEKQQIPWEV